MGRSAQGVASGFRASEIHEGARAVGLAGGGFGMGDNAEKALVGEKRVAPGAGSPASARDVLQVLDGAKGERAGTQGRILPDDP